MTLWLLKKVAALRVFIHAETSFFYNLWLFKEVVLKRGFNFKRNIFEFLRFRL